jgi:CDP-glycerol glycerophosphotransferase
MFPEIELVWQTDPKYFRDFPPYIRIVKAASVLSIFEQVTSKVWVFNTRVKPITRKRKSQFYIQTWHGAIGIKKSERDAVEKISEDFIKRAYHDSPLIDRLISNSSFCTQFFQRAFWYKGLISEMGYPRNDIFFSQNKSIENKVHHYFNIESDTRILLYAPTFRKKINIWNSIALDIPRILATLKKKYGSSWICLLRLHPWAVKYDSNKISLSNQIIDASNYPDIQEMLSVSDVLISDYSSCMFDFLISRKPAFMYAPDIHEYINERGLLFDPFKLPFSCAINNEEIEKHILDFNNSSYIHDIDSFFKEHHLIDDGHASERVAQLIKDKLTT